MVSDVQQLYQGVEALQMVFLLSLAGVTACVILAAAVASRRLYSPIERLMEIGLEKRIRRAGRRL